MESVVSAVVDTVGKQIVEIVVSAIVIIVGSLIANWASPYASYFFHFGKNVEEFKVRRKQLESKKVQVKNDVDKATGQFKEIENEVRDWLEMAEKILEEAQSLEDEVERNKCFKWCPNWGWRYCLSKKVVKTTLLISERLESSNFSQIGHRSFCPGIEFLKSDNFMPSESSEAAFNGIMNALTSNGVDIIGLHGMPGVGKTTLAIKVGKQAIEQKLKVVFVTSSQDPDIKNIRAKIVKTLNFGENEVTAEDLWWRLKDEKNVLIIVDDVWDRLDLGHIGIPVGDNCKILLTTRLQEVCTKMDCKEEIELKILSEDKAWDLFKYNAGLEDPSPLSQIAKEVAKECKGLPLAIIVVGRALKGKTLYVWEEVNQQFKVSRYWDGLNVCDDVFRSLKISYDRLRNYDRSCLHLCSLFPEDSEIEMEELTVSGIGQGMFDFDDGNSIEEARRKMRVITENLLKSGLLLETGGVGGVKMHDVVRDFVHWITSKEKNVFLPRSGLKEWPRRVSFGCCTAISLINCEINNFPDKLEFPKLEVFWLDVKRWTILRVPSTFFQGMKALKVLFLREVILSLEGLPFLSNLRTLRLEHCELENVSWLEKLEKLEILIIVFSQNEPRCYELRGSTTLRLLDLFSWFSKVSFPPNYLQSLFQLEELCLAWCVEWAMNEENANKASLSELQLLPHLKRLEVRSECIPKQFVFPRLQRYKIFVYDSDFVDRDRQPGNLLFLKVKKFSLDAYKELFCNVEVLELNDIMDLEYLSEVATAQNLNELFVEGCGQLQVIFQMDGVFPRANEETQTPLVSSLTSLHLRSLPELQCIWKGPTHHVSLRKLKVVRVSDCNKLTSVFSPSLAQTLVHLEELEIRSCGELKHIISTEPGMDDVALQSQSKDKIYHLEKFNITNCLNLASLCPMGQNLKEVVIKSCDQLREIFQVDEDIHSREANQAPLMSNLTWLDLRQLSELRCIWKGSTHHVSLRNLKVVWVEGCNKLTSVFSPSLAQTLVHLEELRIQSCHGLERVFDSAIINLENITAQSCVQLQGPSHSVINLRSLKTVNISNCNRLRCLFPASLVKSLVQLEELFLNDLPELERLITEPESDLEEEQQVSNMVKEKVDEQHNPLLLLMLPSLKGFRFSKCPRLTPFVIQHKVNNQAQVKGIHLSNRQCNSLDILLRQSLPNLEHGIVGNHLQFLEWLIISNCSELKYVFSPMLAQSLSHLRTLSITQCAELKYVFSPMLAQSLPHLITLTIRQCKDLEQIVDKDKPSASSSQGHFQPICFPSLNKIDIEECNNLKSLFSVSVALSLPQLWAFEIRGASKLEHVFEYQDEIGIDDIEKEIVLPLLRRLSLEMLPRLKNFIPMGYHCSFPNLRFLDVKECPNLTTSFSKDSEPTIYARTKEAGNAPMDGSATNVDAMEVSNTNGETAWPVGSDIEWFGPGCSRVAK